MTLREKDEWAAKGWVMYDVPCTFSILAPSAEAARAFAQQTFRSMNEERAQSDSAAYNSDHIFVDGSEIHPCDCTGH